MDGMDLPSSESEGETETVEREQKTIVLGGKTEKEERKARQKELEAARKEAMAKEQAMQEDDDAFNVRCANLTDEHREQMANSKDIKIDGFSVSARGKRAPHQHRLDDCARPPVRLGGPQRHGQDHRHEAAGAP